jgi:hypothetical protein
MHSVVIIAPYLTLDQGYEFDDWWIGPVRAYTGRWQPSGLRRAVEQLLRRFVDVERVPIVAPTLIANRTDGVGGPMLSPDTIEALRLTVQFGVLAANPTWPYAGWDGLKAVALENVDIWFQPVDLADKFISLHRGTRIRTLGGGYRYNDQSLRIPPPLELASQRTATFDPDIAEALLGVLTNPPAGNDQALRLRPAIHWWLKAWANNANTSNDDRVLFLKTAIEALTGESAPSKAANVLHEMFQRTPPANRGELLWQDDEPSYPKRPGYDGPNPQTAFSHFICAFGYQRNRIVHDGAATAHTYVQEGSRYEGHFVDVADRIVREAILVALGECGYSGLSRSAGHREVIRRVRAIGGAENDPVFDVTETPTDDGWLLTVREHPQITATVADTADTVQTITRKIADALGIDEMSFTVYAFPELKAVAGNSTESIVNDPAGASPEPAGTEETSHGA